MIIKNQVKVSTKISWGKATKFSLIFLKIFSKNKRPLILLISKLKLNLYSKKKKKKLKLNLKLITID